MAWSYDYGTRPCRKTKAQHQGASAIFQEPRVSPWFHVHPGAEAQMKR